MTSEELFEALAEIDNYSQRLTFLDKYAHFINADFLSLLVYHCDIFSDQKEYSIALELCQIALWILSGKIQNDFLKLHFLLEKSKLLFQKKLKKSACETLLELKSECLKSTDDIKGAFLLDMGILYQENGCLEESFACFIEGREVFENSCDSSSLVAVITNLGVNCCERGALEEAKEYFIQAMDLSYKINETQNLANILLGIGYSYDMQGNYMEAKEYYSRALNYSRGDRLKHAHLLYNLAFVNKREECNEISFELYRESSEILKELDVAYSESYYYYYRGLVQRYLENWPEFFTSWHNSLRSLDKAGKSDNRKTMEFYIRDTESVVSDRENDVILTSNYYFSTYLYRGKREFSLPPYKEEWKRDMGKSFLCHIENYSFASPRGEYNILVSCLKNLGYMYLNKGNFKKALHSFRETLSLQWENKDFHKVADTLEGLGKTYRSLKNDKHSLVFYSEAAHRSLSSHINRINDFDNKENWLYFFLGYPEFAFLLWSTELAEARDDFTNSPSNLFRLARLYQSLDLEREASFFIDNATKE